VIHKKSVVLVGGQAVAVWMAQLAERLPVNTSEQITSRDIDFLGGKSDVQRAAELLDAKLTLKKRWSDRANPLIGVATFVDSSEHIRRLDFLERVHGLRADDIRTTAIEIEIEHDGRSVDFWVMHPERCLESRVRNSELPNKQTVLAYRQLEASIFCAKAFNELLLDEQGDAGAVAVRKLIERIFELASQPAALRLHYERHIDVTAAVVEDSRLPEKFLQLRLPQLREQLTRQRVKFASQQDPSSAT
jgi:hypothetical protein